jgi:uroporphyrinogen III methyltransferase / synthase
VSRPLAGKRVLVARPVEQSSSTVEMLEERGAEAIVAPAITIHDPIDPEPMQRAVRELRTYGWAAFTSINGVERALREVERQGGGARAFDGVKIAVVGPKTAKGLDRLGLRPSVVADEHHGEGLARAMLEAMGGARPRVLIARAKDAREVLPETLRGAGCVVDVVPFYETRLPDAAMRAELAGRLAEGGIDAVLLTSASTVASLCETLGEAAPEVLKKTIVASIGPITSAAAATCGVRVDVTARVHTLVGLLEALEESLLATKA